MLYIKDNVVKDSSLIVLEVDGKKMYNPKDIDLVSAGWTKVSDESITGEFFIKKTIYTTSTEFEQLEKDYYKNCLVFIQDTNKIWLNNKYYGGIKIGYEQNEKNYPVELNDDGQAYVNVPWTDTDEKVKTINSPETNYYLCGSTSSDSSTGEYLVKKPTVYVDYTNDIVYAGGFNEPSDERLKNFTERISVDLDKLSGLKKNYFTWKDSENKEQQLGVSAQEIRELYPDIVSEQDNGILTVAYDKLSVIALAAIDELHKKNKELEERLTALENKLK